MNYAVIMTYKCIGRLCRVYEVDAEEDAIKLASSGKGYSGEDIDDIVSELDIIVEENE